MGYLTIRNVSDTTILKLDEIAKKKGMSRQALIRNILDTFVLSSCWKQICRVAESDNPCFKRKCENVGWSKGSDSKCGTR